jgi:aryl-alcohol dehydrogenase-like predicted oxidoreductase
VTAARQLPPATIGLGCEPLGGCDWGTPDLEAARAAVRAALALGVTVFDTADVYGLGRSEEELARALGPDRHRVTIVTKGGVRWSVGDGSGRAATVRDASASHLAAAIDASLTRLRLDAIPLYLVHWPDPNVPLEESLACLEHARAAGKIVRYGLSNVDVAVACAAARTFPISVVEGPCSLLEPDALIEGYKDARRSGLDVLTYGPLAQGLLTGKYAPGVMFDATDRRHRLEHFSESARQRHSPLLTALSSVASETGRTPAQVALRWVIDTGASTVVIAGARTAAQVEDNLGAFDGPLTPEQTGRLTAARELAMCTQE